MSLRDVRKALYSHLYDSFQDSNSDVLKGWELYSENDLSNPPNGADFAQVTFVPSTPTPDTLGRKGDDLATGFVQVDLNVAQDVGTDAVEKQFDLIRQLFIPGTRVVSEEQEVVVTSTGRSGGRYSNGYYVVSVTINWEAWLSRFFGCTITLTDDAADQFGAQVPTINGQTYSVAPEDGSGLYLASTAIPAALRALPTTGILWLRVTDVVASASSGSGSVESGFSLHDSNGDATHRYYLQKDNNGSVTLVGRVIGGGTVDFSIQLSGRSDRDNEYIGIGADGNAYYWNPDEQQPDLTAELSGFIDSTGAVSCGIIGAVDLTGGGTGTYSARFDTDSSNYPEAMTGENFCGETF